MKHADLLKPYAIHVAGIHSAISALSDDELTKLLAASESATQTNCWRATYRAAKLIGPEIRREIEARRSAAEATLAKTKRTDIAPGCGDAGERANTDGRLEFMPFYIEQKLNLIERLRHEATNFGGIQSNVGELLKEAAEWIVGGET